MSLIRLYQLFNLVLCLTANVVFAQELTFLDSIPIDGSKIVVDKMGYMYAVESDRIIKYNPQGDSMFYYSNKLLGEIDQLEETEAQRLAKIKRKGRRSTKLVQAEDQLTLSKKTLLG